MKLGHLRFGSFLCWILTGHIWDKTRDRRMMGHEMNCCIYCGIKKPGPE